MCSLIICCPSTCSSLYNSLKSHRHFFEGDSFSDNSSSSSLILIHTKEPCNIIAPHPIIVYPKGIVGCQTNEKTFATVLNSSFTKADELQIENDDCQLITCGMCDSDCLTFSSFLPECAVISIQYTIKTITGRTIEPCEIPISISLGASQFDILAMCALLLLCDRGDCIGTTQF